MTMGSPHTEDSTRILTRCWERTDDFEPRSGTATRTSWVVRTWGPSRCADALVTALLTEGAEVTLVREDASTGGGARGEHHVLFLNEAVPLTGPDLADEGSWAWAHAAVRLCRHVASLPEARLWIVTRTGLNGPARGAVTRPEQDFVWALGRCHAAESPESWGGLVDVAIDDPRVAGRALADYLLSGSPEDEVLLADDGPSVARLRASLLPPAASGHGVSMDRLHIVSGGALGLSFEIERWLAGRGAKRLLILGRTPLDDDRKRNLRRLESMGCAVDHEVLDVGDPESVRRLTARLRGEPVGGVFHLASHPHATSATPEQTRLLIGAKAGGALLLGELAEELGAEAMVLFSSAAATLGSPGQTGYAAANAVLDGVARRLHGGRVRAVSIAWGPVGDVGFGATREGADLHETWERLGLGRLTVGQVLSAVDMALSQDEPNLSVVTWEGSTPGMPPWFRQRPVLEALSAVEPVGLSLEHLAELEDEQRVPYIVQVVGKHLANMLNRAPEDIDPDRPLLRLGIDSLIALELLFVIDREFAVRLELREVLVDLDATLRTTAGKLDERVRVAR
ncbi:KR domain-containing protein [Streptosporangium saharense]|uniref:KR domain-containing protein n=1 Tax=Streptosporangium saharense TaxID=1706840 RepID=UPI003693A886